MNTKSSPGSTPLRIPEDYCDHYRITAPLRIHGEPYCVVETDILIVATPSWPDRPQSRDPTWKISSRNSALTTAYKIMV